VTFAGGTRQRLSIVFALLLIASAVSVSSRPGTPPETDRARAVEIQKKAVQGLRDGARAAASGDGPGFSRALEYAADEITALVAAAPWLSASERATLDVTAKSLKSRAAEPPRGYVPDADLGVLDHVGYRLRGGTDVELVFEGSFAKSQPPEEPVYGGHATAMGPPPRPVRVGAATDRDRVIRFDAVRGQLTEKTYGGGPSKWHLVESGGNGVALIDYDGDGLLDVYTVSGFDLDERNGRTRIPHRNALYHNLGGMKFENVAAKAGVDAAAWGYGVCAGDFDDDGRIDLYVTNYGRNLLYRNKGDGTFEEVAVKAGVALDGWSTGCAFLDANGDGKLDLYVARYVTAPEEEVANPERFLMWRGIAKVMLGPAGLPGAADVFFENQGNGTFKEATAKYGLTDTNRAYGFGVVATDYDSDGWTDIFVANDSNPNFLYHNRAGRGFESVGLAAGVAMTADGRSQAGMGADAGDYDNDGRPDIALAAFAFDHNSLYHNLGGGVFEDVSQNAGLVQATFERMSWGVAFLDADLDGQLDLFFANGHLFPQVDEYPELKEGYAQRNQIFRNEGGVFRDVSATSGRGLTVLKCNRAVAVGDLDNDGDPDLVVTAMDEEPTLLENAQTSGHHWLGVEVRQKGLNSFAIGARVTAEDGQGRKRMREIRSGGGYLSQNDLRALFGLGDCKGPISVEVRLGGTRWRFPGLAVDRYVRVDLDEEHRLRP
jgi:enediyne biosynthesis protein E4